MEALSYLMRVGEKHLTRGFISLGLFDKNGLGKQYVRFSPIGSQFSAVYTSSANTLPNYSLVGHNLYCEAWRSYR